MDELTGLKSIGELAALFKTSGSNELLSIYLNIDGFNGVNYAFGHIEGDRILVEVAKWLSQKATILGFEVFRVGGNEFLMIGSGSHEHEIQRIAEELVRESQTLGLPYEHPLSSRTTFSLSAVVFQARGSEHGTLRTALDCLSDAAYSAELKAGRNFGVVGFASVVEF